MGVVELAIREEGRFRRLYAVKRLRDIYRDETDFREMFLEEARIAGLIRHPNVVSVLDVGDDERGPFLVMDYVEGTSAGQIIERASAAGQEVPMQVALRIVMDAANGIHAAHELRDARNRPMNLVHRDVSPQNLLVGYDGITRVTDFGIAKAWGRTTRTATGVLKGKFGYLSPEQLRFEEPDRRSDIFSLGVVLYELLSGKRLYKNKAGMDGARRILKEPPPDLGEVRDDVPAELIELSFSMLAKDPAHRPDHALEVARKLETILAELAAIEGRVEVADFVSEAFAAERRAQADRVTGAIASATGELALPATDPGRPSVKPPIVGAAAGTDGGARRESARLLPIIAVAGVIGVAAAVGLIMATDRDGGEAPPPAEAPAPTAVTAAADEETTPEPAEVPDDPVVADEAAEDEVEPADAAGETEGAPARMRSSRMRGRTMRGARSMSSMSGVPMWDWQ